ncbi:hypothetical protein PA598K_06803 [Paenibacillus sp. 598K]|nr:hypothetical protein PA598K_06803 [Paenibacillus sp. 598K]
MNSARLSFLRERGFALLRLGICLTCLIVVVNPCYPQCMYSRREGNGIRPLEPGLIQIRLVP